MLDALLDGQDDPEMLAELARGRLRAKLADLRKALDGRVQPHHRLLLTRILAHIDFLEESLAQLQTEMEQYLDPNARSDGASAERGRDQRDGFRQTYCLLGRGLSGQQAEWGEATQWQNHQRQSISASNLVRAWHGPLLTP